VLLKEQNNYEEDFSKGGVYSMMGYGFEDMMGGAYGSSYFGLFQVLVGITTWIVLVLLAVYLYQKIKIGRAHV